jgi:hypothetical protein
LLCYKKIAHGKIVPTSVTIVDFEKCHHFSPYQCLGGAEMKLDAKFCENLTQESEFILFYVNFKILADGHLELFGTIGLFQVWSGV